MRPWSIAAQWHSGVLCVAVTVVMCRPAVHAQEVLEAEDIAAAVLYALAAPARVDVSCMWSSGSSGSSGVCAFTLLPDVPFPLLCIHVCKVSFYSVTCENVIVSMCV